MDEYCDISFVQQVIEANTTIPVILVTQEDSVISYKNIPERLQESRKLQQLVEEYKKQVPVKRFGKVEEVASAVLFLASCILNFSSLFE